MESMDMVDMYTIMSAYYVDIKPPHVLYGNCGNCLVTIDWNKVVLASFTDLLPKYPEVKYHD